VRTLREPTGWDVMREVRHFPAAPAAVAVGVVVAGVLLRSVDTAAAATAMLVVGVGAVIGGLVALTRSSWAVAGWLAAGGGVVAAAGWVCRLAAGVPLVVLLSGVGGVALWGVVAWWWWDRLVRPLDSGMVVVRDREHSNHNDGAASKWDLWAGASESAMRAQARTVRPSLAGLSDRELAQVPATEFAVLVARTGWSLGAVGGGAEVWSSCEDVTLRTGGPRMGKSASLACHMVDAPGALLCTSTRLDLLDVTREVRARKGQILVFNPTGLGDGRVPSTIRWSPLAGCMDFPTAQRRAESMIQGRSGDAEIWAEQARRILAVLLHAAAMKGARMQRVADWLADASPVAGDEIIAALEGTSNVLALASDVQQFIGTNDRTRTSITSSIAPALRWLANSAAAEVGDADPAEAFDVRSFIEDGTGSLYLIGSPETAPVTPLISALTAEVGHQLRMAAAARPDGRLDPPFTLVLDEMTLAIPELDVAQWTSDMGGRGVTMHLSIQSPSQMRDVWSADRAASILNNVGTLLVFGGTKDPTDLDAISKLTGQRLETLDEDDNRYTPLQDPATIASLPKFRVLVFSPGLRPVLGWAPQIWQRSDGRAVAG
jgi:type IV secretion system protein VirD4